jgi:hypothetical protein
MRIRKLLCRLVVFLSVLFNVWTLFDFSSLPDYKLGILKNDLEVASFRDTNKFLFKIPKGLAVLDASPRGLATLGAFHNNYIIFRIEVDDDGSMVDYSAFATSDKSPIDAEYAIYGRSAK